MPRFSPKSQRRCVGSGHSIRYIYNAEQDAITQIDILELLTQQANEFSFPEAIGMMMRPVEGRHALLDTDERQEWALSIFELDEWV